MWRLWTRGWGVRAWWFWWRTEGFPIWVAWRLPRRVALWAFIRVYANSHQSPGPEYALAHDVWMAPPKGLKEPRP